MEKLHRWEKYEYITDIDKNRPDIYKRAKM